MVLLINCVKKNEFYRYLYTPQKEYFYFSKDDTYHKTMVNEKNEWLNFEFNKKRELIINYLD